MSKRPEFTIEQEIWIAEEIDNWYLIWKDKIVDYDRCTHNLGYAKELLKDMLLPIKE